MSCSVKISSAKSWSGSQRRINALAEESAVAAMGPSPPGCTSSLNQQQQQPIIGAASGPTSPQQQQNNGVAQPVTAAPQHHSLRPVKSAVAAKRGEDVAKLLRYIDENVIGKNGTFLGPFGRRKVTYCDYTATGRSLQFLEDYIFNVILPYLGDTRASTSICSLQSSLFRHEARDIVRHAVGADEDDAVLFTGQSTAGALRTLLRHLDLTTPTTVFVGPFEHHANLRPWREHGVKLVRIDETREGFLDLNDLERKLVEERATSSYSRLVGYFSAASCITGVLADEVATTLLLRQHGALSIWDYTSAAPYVKMEMNPHLPGVDGTTVHKDAMIFSGHKLIGGAQTPGVLVVKRSLLLDEDVGPEDMRDSHRYLRDPELREESGTGGIVESVRCALAVQLKENITPQVIASRQDKITKQVLSHVRTIPELILLGCSSQNVKRLPTFSFMVRHPRGTFLHHNFVCAVLNDVFGVQARGGCACAGRYAHDLMGIDEKLAREYEALLLQSNQNVNNNNNGIRDESNAETLRPGFTRLTFPYFMSEAEIGFVLEALKMVATEGWKLLPQYVLNPETGEWRHHTNSVFKDRRWLGSIRYTDGRMSATERRVSGPGVFPQSHSDCLQTARNTFNRARKMAQKFPMQIDRSVSFGERSEALRWFMLPREAQDLLLGNSQNVKHHVPFDPIRYRLALLDNSCFVGMRRLNSDVPRGCAKKVPITPNSPRHRSLPALTTTATMTLGKTKGMAKSCDVEDDEDQEDEEIARAKKLPATCPGSPMPVRFAVGEAVTTAAVGILGSSNPAIARLVHGVEHQSDHSNDSNGHTHSGSEADSPVYVARVRCNSLGSSTECRGRSGSTPGTTSPVPIPLSPQTLASLGIAAASGSQRHRHCSCSSQTELDGPGRSASSLGHVSTTSPPLGSATSSSSFDTAIGTHRLGRSSPILSSVMRQSSEDDLRAYFKERTRELATEIKSELREVISKVDDALSESNTTDSSAHHYHQHHPRTLERQQHHDSFSASDIAEYLMEFSKEMASEVKSEIREMVSSVDGLHRYSPDDRSSSGCNSPSDRRRATSGLLEQHNSRCRTPILPGKVSELSQHESKMSSECSSDETVIYVVKPSPTAENPPSLGKPHQPQPAAPVTTSNNTDDDDEAEHSEPEKNLPKIYSAVNSVSSQDSGINLSFQDSDRSVDGSAPELGRSSSAESTSNGCCGRNSTTSRPRLGTAATGLGLCKQARANDDLSEDDETFFSATQLHTQNLEGATDAEEQHQSPGPWHCPPKNVWKPTVEALQEFNMIRDGDRLLLCLTPGGASSMSLLHALHQYRFYGRSKGLDFEIGVASVARAPEHRLTTYLTALGVPYFCEDPTNSGTTKAPPSSSSSCTSFCEKATRAKLYALAKTNGYNVLALGQNLDDLTEGFLGSFFNNGKLKTMKAHYYIREQDLRVVRPFVYVRDKALRQFADGKKLPVSKEPTPAGAVKANGNVGNNEEEEAVESLEDARPDSRYPRLYWSLRSALRPLISTHPSNPGADGGEQLQKRQQHRRPRTNSFSAVPLVTSGLGCVAGSAASNKRIDDDDETDEEPIS
ncbi:uncharacterized protein LOC106638097 [Copidosoma floridanum]|uniref:uncharacterized protein LOC106638097 n=1 Tax=Copidosoma floridanum TaxID=29053 RepID=UPI0006C9C3E7|nr:uncharacterized protein LOC106638097 [Copidosoma floridanum]